MNATQLFILISKNYKIIDELPNELIQIEKKDFFIGDEFSNETGYDFILFFKDKTAYRVTKTFYNEIDENGYNDGYSNHSVREYYDNKNCSSDEIYNKISLEIIIN